MLALELTVVSMHLRAVLNDRTFSEDKRWFPYKGIVVERDIEYHEGLKSSIEDLAAIQGENPEVRQFISELEKIDKKEIRGSLPYLPIESHSVSRRVLHAEVAEFLKAVGPEQ